MLTECREMLECSPEETVMEIPSGGFVQLVYTCEFTTEAPTFPLDQLSPTSSSSDSSFFDWLPELNLPSISIPSRAVFGVAVGLITTISAVIIGCTCCKCCSFTGRRQIRSRQQSGNTDSLLANSCATLETNVWFHSHHSLYFYIVKCHCFKCQNIFYFIQYLYWYSTFIFRYLILY